MSRLTIVVLCVSISILVCIDQYYQFHFINWSVIDSISRNPLIIAVVAFFFTNIVGTRISQSLQDRSWKNQDFEMRKEKQLEAASKLFEEVSSLMDKRLYLERRVLYAHQDRKRGLPDKTAQCFSDYNLFLYEWNFSLNKNICKLEQYFGHEIKSLFHDRISKDFNWIGILLRRLHLNIQSPSFSNILGAIDITNERVFKLDQKMLSRLKNGTVEDSRD